MALFKVNAFQRGTSVIFLATFTDQNGNPITPTGAQVSIVFQTPAGAEGGSIVIPMLAPGTPGGDPVQWYAAWDSRGALPGEVYWSLHSGAPVPVVVTDGQFNLT